VQTAVIEFEKNVSNFEFIVVNVYRELLITRNYNQYLGIHN